MMRASAIHGLAGMAAIMASTYKAYLGEGLPEPLNSWLQKFKIPHPGRVRIASLPRFALKTETGTSVERGAKEM